MIKLNHSHCKVFKVLCSVSQIAFRGGRGGGYNIKTGIWVEGINLWWVGREFFQVRKMSRFLAGATPHSPVGKTCYEVFFYGKSFVNTEHVLQLVKALPF